MQTTLDEGLMIISVEQSLYFANMGQMKDNLRRIEQVWWLLSHSNGSKSCMDTHIYIYILVTHALYVYIYSLPCPWLLPSCPLPTLTLSPTRLSMNTQPPQLGSLHAHPSEQSASLPPLTKVIFGVAGVVDMDARCALSSACFCDRCSSLSLCVCW